MATSLAIPVSTLTGTTTDSVEGIPSNDQRRFNFEVESSNSVIIDYVSKFAPTGDFKKITGLRVLINSIRNLLLTPVGSYPFDPLYGSDLFKKVFEPADAETEASIKHEVIDKIKIYDGRIHIEEVFTEFFSDRKGFRLNIFIQRDRDQVSTSLDFTEDTGFSIEEG